MYLQWRGCAFRIQTYLGMQGRNKCWALNGQQFQPEVKGLRGLLRTYRSGPHGADIKSTVTICIPECYNALERLRTIYCQDTSGRFLHMPTTAKSGPSRLSRAIIWHADVCTGAQALSYGLISYELLCVMYRRALHVATCCQDVLTRNTV